MNFFSRLFGGSNEPVPEWAGFFRPREYGRFLKVVAEELVRRGTPHVVEDGVVHVTERDGDSHQYGLQNIAQVCRMHTPAEWPSLVERHFENLFAAKGERQALEADLADYAKIAHLLRVRLFPEDLPEGVRGGSVNRSVAPGITAVLAFDLPTSVVSVGRKEADAWGIPDDELLRDGLENVFTSEPVNREDVEVADDVKLTALMGDSFFTASHVLMLEKHLSGPAEHGALVAVPHRHAVFFHVIDGPAVVRAVGVLLQMAMGMYQEGPGSISPSVYWWRDGELTLLPSSLEGSKLDFFPPDEFVEVVNRLCTEADSSPEEGGSSPQGL